MKFPVVGVFMSSLSVNKKINLSLDDQYDVRTQLTREFEGLFSVLSAEQHRS